MPPITYTATAFSTLDKTSGAEALTPKVNKPGPARLLIAENVRFTKEGGVSVRAGFEETADLATTKAIEGLATIDTGAFTLMFAKSGTAIFQSLDGITWYNIGVTRTDGEEEFFFAIGKNVYATNKTDSYLRIAVSTLATALTAGSTEVVVRTGDGDIFTDGVAAIYIEGDEIDYDGVTTNTLDSATNIAGAHAVGAIVTQATTPSGAPKGTCITELEKSTLVGGVSSARNVIHYSAPGHPDNPEYYYDFSSNGAGKTIMESDVTAIKTGMGVTLIGMKQGIAYATGFDALSGILKTEPISRTHSIPNAFCITEMDQEFAVLTTEGRILPVMNTDAGFQIVDDPNKPEANFDFPVAGYIKDNKDEDMSTASVHYDPASRILRASIPINGISQHFVYQRDIGAWSIDTTTPFGKITNSKGRVYAGAADTDKIYLVDEGTTDDNIPFAARVVTGLLTTDQKRVSNDYLNLIFSGLLSGNGLFTFRIYTDEQLFISEDVSAEDLVNANLMSTSSGIPLGGGTVGAGTVGSTGSVAEVYKFTYPYEFMVEGESIQVEWEVTDEGTSFELRGFKIDGETVGALYLDSQ